MAVACGEILSVTILPGVSATIPVDREVASGAGIGKVVPADTICHYHERARKKSNILFGRMSAGGKHLERLLRLPRGEGGRAAKSPGGKG
jgi:hypothetical protein